jgi:hypothetical protein
MVKKKKKQSKRNTTSVQRLNTRRYGSVRQQLADLGFYVHEVPEDGHCLFNSLLDQLGDHSKVSDHMALRRLLMDKVSDDEEFFSMFIEDDESFDAYVKRMLDDGWGGQIELQASSVVHNCNIRIYQDDLPSWTIKNFPDDHLMLHVSYHDGNHYNSVRDRESGKPASLVWKGDAQPVEEEQTQQSIVEVPVVEDYVVKVKIRERRVECQGEGPMELVLVVKKRPGGGAVLVGDKKCPCGSNKKYKKCCKKRIERSKNTLCAQEESSLSDAVKNIYL